MAEIMLGKKYYHVSVYRSVQQKIVVVKQGFKTAPSRLNANLNKLYVVHADEETS
jgi:hypothetical protein